MIIFAVLILLFILGVALICTNWDENTGVVGVILAIVSIVFLIISLISLVTHPIEVKSDISKFLATKVTIEKARRIDHKRIDWLLDAKTIDIQGVATIVENAVIQHKVIESNQWLAKQQYYNSTIFGLWIPDEVDKLKPIR